MADGFIVRKGGVAEEPSFISATGGNIVDTFTQNEKNYKYHVFTSSGTFTVSQNQDQKAVEFLLIGGGGGGNENSGAGQPGGGAGGFLSGYHIVNTQSYTITIGAGGTSGGHGNITSFLDYEAHKGMGLDQNASSFDALVNWDGTSDIKSTLGIPFASTSGSRGTNIELFPIPNFSNQGNSGGKGNQDESVVDNRTGGGGGGAGQVGQAGSSSKAGNGGNGKTTTIIPNDIGIGEVINGDIWFAGGGGGTARRQAQTTGTGGNGGGGNGGSDAGATTNGAVNTGGGGGGISQTGGSNSSNGGSGIAIIRYEVGGL